MNKQVICGAAAILLTGLSWTMFVSAEPTNLDRRTTEAYAPAATQANAPVIQFPCA